MYFRDLVESEEQWQNYEKLLLELAGFVGDCVRFVIDAYNVAQVTSSQDRCYSHATVQMLARHVIESVDGLSVLVERGCAENCGPLLRSAFEAQLGVLYILDANSKRRALSYQVAHAHRKIKAYRKCDPNDPLGKQLRAELKDDPMTDVFNRVPFDLQAMVANLEGMFKKPEYAPIEAEWQASRKNKDPEWFALFGGPRDVRSLAIHLKLGAVYEGLYRSWSDVIHAGSGFNHVGPSDQPGTILIRPVRHPDGLESACTFAAEFCLNTARTLVQKYDPAQWERFRKTFSEKIGPHYMEISKGKLINAPWR